MKTRVALALMALGAFLAAIVLTAAPMVHADTSSQDAEYLYLLDHFGIYNNQGSGAAIAGAHLVCAWRADGVSEIDVITKVYGQSSLTERNSILLVGIAEEVYCPSYWSGNSQSATTV